MFKKLSIKTKIAIVGMLLYVVLPIDLIPDFIVGFGQVDDMAVIMYVVKCLYSDLKKKKIDTKVIEG